MNDTLKCRLAMELFTHLSEQEQEYIISLIVSILSKR